MINLPEEDNLREEGDGDCGGFVPLERRFGEKGSVATLASDSIVSISTYFGSRVYLSCNGVWLFFLVLVYKISSLEEMSCIF